jgi:D-alanine-D-alanine ligase-like ATP-grasp enzyme
VTERVRVAVLAGGPSAEHEVSLQSAQAVLDALPRDLYEPVAVIIDRQGRWPVELRRDRMDVVFPVLHGPFGEDGVVQGHLEALGLPYMGCGVLASAVAMDKVAMRRTFLAEDVRELALRAFRAIGGYGLSRVDFRYEQSTGRPHLLEINTMPGFTSRSVYVRAWAASGVPYPDLLRRLIDLAFARSSS